MNIKITYPELNKKKATRAKLIRILRLPFFALAVACPIVNIATKGVPWSIVALFGLYMVWKLAVEIDLIEYNRISQYIKFITYSIIMLILIARCITPSSNWDRTVIPIVTFSALVVAAVLFYTDFERQRHNLMPLLLIDIITLVASIIMLIRTTKSDSTEAYWPYIVMGSVSLLFLVSLAFTLKGGLVSELKRRFHTKIY